MLIIGNGLTRGLEQEDTYTVFPCFCFTHTNSVSLKSSGMRKGGSSALMKYSCQCVWKCMRSEVCSCDWKREFVCTDKCVWSLLPISGALHSSCVLTLCLGGEWKGGWAEERRGEGESVCSKARARRWERLTRLRETQRVDGEDRWTSARVSQQQQKQESTLFFPHPSRFAFSTAFPGSSVIGRVVERSTKEWRKGAQQRGMTCPRPASMQRWGVPWREVEKLITVLGYKLFRQVNGSAKLWEVDCWRLALWN